MSIHPTRLRRHRLTASNKSEKPAKAEVRCPPELIVKGEYLSNNLNRSAKEGLTADRTFTMPMAAVSKEINLTMAISEKENLDFIICASGSTEALLCSLLQFDYPGIGRE